jgi:hypothetical protein
MKRGAATQCLEALLDASFKGRAAAPKCDVARAAELDGVGV